MKRCIDCGKRNEREGHQDCQYPGLRLAAKRGPSRVGRERQASREEQHGRYLDCGPGAWDDR
jgi:hypothetical protein